jgi:hypothetical protein
VNTSVVEAPFFTATELGMNPLSLAITLMTPELDVTVAPPELVTVDGSLLLQPRTLELRRPRRERVAKRCRRVIR